MHGRYCSGRICINAYDSGAAQDGARANELNCTETCRVESSHMKRIIQSSLGLGVLVAAAFLVYAWHPEIAMIAVSYTHLTLPTNREV